MFMYIIWVLLRRFIDVERLDERYDIVYEIKPFSLELIMCIL